MASLIGNTSGTVTSTALNIPSKIISFSFANKTGGGGTVSLGLLSGSTFDILNTYPLTATGTAGASYIYLGNPIIVPSNYSIVVIATVSTDYVISVETF